MGAERIHSEIADLLKEAEEELNTDQMKWDRYLVNCFFNHVHANTYYLSVKFQEENGMSEETFFSLKRTPKPFKNHMRTGFARFISAYLPTIAKVLWDQKKENADKIALAINKSNVDTRIKASDKDSMTEDRKVIRSGVYADIKSAKQRKAFRNMWLSHRRSNQWGVTK